MEYEALDHLGPVLMKPKVHKDLRGFFMETFRKAEFEHYCGKYEFVQDNCSKSVKNVLRGLHYQLKHPQGKLIRVSLGSVWDVAVDLREHSKFFGKHYAVELTDKNNYIFWIPPGFAHGFYVLSDEVEFGYKCTDYYAPGDEYCICYDDAFLNIGWPFMNDAPIVSEKDRKCLQWNDAPKYKF